MLLQGLLSLIVLTVVADSIVHGSEPQPGQSQLIEECQVWASDAAAFVA